MKPESMLREVKVEDAVGMILPHDFTQILPRIGHPGFAQYWQGTHLRDGFTAGLSA
jgi:hypothetical protein